MWSHRLSNVHSFRAHGLNEQRMTLGSVFPFIPGKHHWNHNDAMFKTALGAIKEFELFKKHYDYCIESVAYAR